MLNNKEVKDFFLWTMEARKNFLFLIETIFDPLLAHMSLTHCQKEINKERVKGINK